MKTNFTVNGKSGSSSSSIAHIERTRALKKKVTNKNNIETNSLKTQPHIIVFNKNIRKKFQAPDYRKKTKTQISKQLQTYKLRVEKYEDELEDLELETFPDYTKIEKKQKTIQKNLMKITELENLSKSTLSKRPNFAFDFVDIPFSITGCKPELLTKEDFKKLNDVALEVLETIFEVDIKKVGQVAHLDQASAHIHLSFYVPEGKTLSQITKTKIDENGDEVKISYADMHKKFNKMMIEAFPNLPIEEISPSDKLYLPLKDYKRESAKQTKESKPEVNNDKILKDRYQNKLREFFPSATTPTELLKELENLHKRVKGLEAVSEDMSAYYEDTSKELKKLKEENEDLKFKIKEFKIEENGYKNEISKKDEEVKELKERLEDKTAFSKEEKKEEIELKEDEATIEYISREAKKYSQSGELEKDLLK